MKILKLLSLTLIVLGTSLAASAASICGSGGGTNISSSGTTTCALGGLTFAFNAPGFSPNATGDALTITAAAINGSDYVLEFGINPGTTGFPVDINIDYLVTSSSNNISGIDASFPGGTSGSIFEEACSVSTIVNPCPAGDLLSAITLTTAGVDAVGTPASFGPVSSLYIHKDIDAITFSEFTDSVQTSAVPEPSTGLLLGSAFCLLGLLSRKLRRS
jgi:hypothetical protein